MRILLLIFGCHCFIELSAESTKRSTTKSPLKTDKHKAVLEEADKEPLISAQRPAFTSAGMHINHIQFVGSHNSYKQAMPDGFVKQLMKINPKSAGGP